MPNDYDLRNMCRTDLEDEVMLLRAKVKVQQNELIRVHRILDSSEHHKDNTIYSLREQLAALRGELASLTCACCDPPRIESSLREMFPSECPDRD